MQLPHLLTVFATGFAIVLSQTSVLDNLGNLGQVTGPMSSLPTCALKGAESSTEAGGCTKYDFTCVCQAPVLWRAYLDKLTEHGAGACDPADRQTAISWGKSFCAGLNITVSGSVSMAKTIFTTATPSTAKNLATTSASTSTVSVTPKSDGTTIAYLGMEIGMAVVTAMAFAL